jgi:hypothetical protein
VIGNAGACNPLLNTAVRGQGESIGMANEAYEDFFTHRPAVRER